MELSFNLDAPLGFQGLHPDKPITYYMRDLPHWRQEGTTYFVTFRLADSLPQSKLNELKSLRREWERQYKHPQSVEQMKLLTKEAMLRVEEWLDQGMGCCRLRRTDASHVVADAMHFFDDQRYELDCYVVMPNHVHVILRPLQEEQHPLEKILQSWKGHSSREIHKLDGVAANAPPFWQAESFDRIVRDEEHLYRVIQYIGRNPRLAKLQESDYQLWIRPDWVELGWNFEQKGNRSMELHSVPAAKEHETKNPHSHEK